MNRGPWCQYRPGSALFCPLLGHEALNKSQQGKRPCDFPNILKPCSHIELESVCKHSWLTLNISQAAPAIVEVGPRKQMTVVPGVED